MHKAFNLIDVKSIVNEDVQKYLFKIAVAARFWSLHGLIRPSFFLYVSPNITAYHKMWKRIALKVFNNSENINEHDLFHIIILLAGFFDKISVCSTKWNVCNLNTFLHEIYFQQKYCQLVWINFFSY